MLERFGARSSEIISIPERDIHLEANISYIDIRDGNGREVKTRNAVPLMPPDPGRTAPSIWPDVIHGRQRQCAREADP
jgi:hypothetical protein